MFQYVIWNIYIWNDLNNYVHSIHILCQKIGQITSSDCEQCMYNIMYLAQSTRKGHVGWQSFHFLLFDGFVFRTYQLGIEIANKKKSYAKVTYNDPWGYIELPFSGQFRESYRTSLFFKKKSFLDSIVKNII